MNNVTVLETESRNEGREHQQLRSTARSMLRNQRPENITRNTESIFKARVVEQSPKGEGSRKWTQSTKLDQYELETSPRIRTSQGKYTI